MGYEVEVKYRVADHEALAAALMRLGTRPGEPVEEADEYRAHPARDFAQTGEAFRMRQSGGAAALTYKGPKHGGPTKTREELEIPFEAGGIERMRTLLDRLGFAPVQTVRKTRRPFALERDGRPMVVVLDRVEGLGEFAEVEALAADAADLPGAQAAVLGLAAELGLEDIEPRSYLRMALERRGTEDDAAL